MSHSFRFILIHDGPIKGEDEQGLLTSRVSAHIQQSVVHEYVRSGKQRGVSAFIERLLGRSAVLFPWETSSYVGGFFLQMSSPDKQTHCGLVSLQDKVLHYSLNYPDEFFLQSCLPTERPCWWQKELCHIRKFISRRNEEKQQFCVLIAPQQLKAIAQHSLGYGARCSVVVKPLSNKPEGCGFDTLWGEFFFFQIPPSALGPWVHSASNRNEYQKQKNIVSAE
jgi:hypothetical protein